jgi:hypothetical protein
MRKASISPKATAFTRSQTGRTQSSKKKRIATKETNAWRGIELATVRECGPTITLQHLRKLEADGHIVFEESPMENKDEFELLPAADVEINMEDEDFDQGQPWGEPAGGPGAAIVLGAQAKTEESHPFPENNYELIICNEVCTFTPPTWAYTCRGATPEGEAQLHELTSRYRTFAGIADWLNKNRKQFLNSRDLLDLGPLTLDEFSKDGAAVVQKDFLRMLRLNPPVSEESFSRFLNQCDFVWPDGSVPVRLIFSNDAKLAWAAQSVILYAKKFGQQLTEKVLEKYQDIQVARADGLQAKSARIDLVGIDFPSFIELANAKVRTRWQDVLLAYRKQMLQS